MCGLIITFFTFIFYMLMFIHFMSLQIGFSLKFWVTFRTWIFEMLTWCVWCQFLTIWQRYSLEGQTNRRTEGQTNGQIEGKIDKMTDRQTEERTDIKTKGQPNRQKDRHSNRKANRHKTRQKRRTNRQKNRHINREIICHLIYTMIKKQNGW